MKIKVVVVFLVVMTHLMSYDFKTSVVIPSYYKHIDFLPHLLEKYAHQTSIPDEVVIALSEADKVPANKLRLLQEESWPFDLVLELTSEQQFAGENRNRGTLASSGDLIIYQDSDDLPHMQRVEVIQECFAKVRFDHLLHSWDDKEREIPYDYPLSLDCQPVDYPWMHMKLHNGQCAISREVLSVVKWPSIWQGQDKLFTRCVYGKFDHCYVLREPLVFYFPNNSSIVDRLVSAIERGQSLSRRILRILTTQQIRTLVDMLDAKGIDTPESIKQLSRFPTDGGVP